ncbi:MAG: sulfatase [Phycisphaeraceae bacterium]|nr:sulfatase [Phycisphaeraceae bacterium]
MVTRFVCFLALFVVVFTASACSSVPATAIDVDQAKQSRPNIIFIFTDDHASQSISAYGSKINQTPHIDRIASEGAIFLNSFCGNSICGPSRATILTGLHSHANGFMTNTNRFDSSQQTFPKLLQKAGYATAMIGKYHLHDTPKGFDHWMILPGQGEYYNPDLITPEGRVRVQGHCTNVVTDLGLGWLEGGRDKDKPFMLMLQHKAPHRTWMPAPEELGLYRDQDIPEPDTLFDDYKGRGKAAANTEMEIDRHMFFAYDLYCPLDKSEALYKHYERKIGRLNEKQRAEWDKHFEPENEAFRKNMKSMSPKQIEQWKYQRYVKNYLRCIAGVDRNIGRVLKYLDDNPGLKENTIVIYSSDQGFYLGEHGWYDKRWMYEESLAMPLVARWPGVIKPGTRVEELVQNIDYAPTFLDLAGAKPETPMHGRSLLDLARKNAGAWRDGVYYHYYEYPRPHRVPPHEGVRTGRYSLMHFYHEDHGYWELYDLEKDPQQTNSVYNDPAYAGAVEKLKVQLEALKQQYKVGVDE